MTETTSKATGAQVAKRRRGVSNATQAVAQLKFHEKDAAQNGLFVGHLHDVRVDWSNGEDSKSFPGLNVPRLTLHFASQHTNANEMRHVYQTLFPQESNVNTIPGGSEEWKVNNVLNWIKHMLDVFYLRGREMTEAEENALELPLEDIDEDGNYQAVDPQEVLNAYQSVFETAAAMLNGTWNLGDGETAKATYKSADGKYIPCWLKLLRHRKRKNDWINVGQNGELGFDNFIGSGCIEILKKDMPPVILRIDLAKESITPKETKKTPTIGAPGMPGMGGGVFAGGMPMGAPTNDAFDQAAMSDMPFD